MKKQIIWILAHAKYALEAPYHWWRTMRDIRRAKRALALVRHGFAEHRWDDEAARAHELRYPPNARLPQDHFGDGEGLSFSDGYALEPVRRAT